jgi:hypothetical protein
MTIQDIQSLAEAHGLLLTDKMNFNEMGIDSKMRFSFLICSLMPSRRGIRSNHCCPFVSRKKNAF